MGTVSITQRINNLTSLINKLTADNCLACEYIEGLQTAIDNINNSINSLQLNQTVIFNSIDDIWNELDTYYSQIQGLTNDVNDIKNEIINIKQDILALKKRRSIQQTHLGRLYAAAGTNWYTAHETYGWNSASQSNNVGSNANTNLNKIKKMPDVFFAEFDGKIKNIKLIGRTEYNMIWRFTAIKINKFNLTDISTIVDTTIQTNASYQKLFDAIINKNIRKNQSILFMWRKLNGPSNGYIKQPMLHIDYEYTI